MENGRTSISIRSDEKLKQIIRENGLLHKITINIFSHRQYIVIGYYLKHRIPIMYRQFFRTISRNPEFVEKFALFWGILFTYRVVNMFWTINNLFHFACRRWMINQYFENMTVFENIIVE